MPVAHAYTGKCKKSLKAVIAGKTTLASGTAHILTEKLADQVWYLVRNLDPKTRRVHRRFEENGRRMNCTLRRSPSGSGNIDTLLVTINDPDFKIKLLVTTHDIMNLEAVYRFGYKGADIHVSIEVSGDMQPLYLWSTGDWSGSRWPSYERALIASKINPLMEKLRWPSGA